MLSFMPKEEQDSTGCRACDGHRKRTNGLVRWCLRHDPTISSELRAKYGVAFEKLPQLREQMTAKRKGRPNVDSIE